MKRSSLYLAFILLATGLVIYFWESPESLLERFVADDSANQLLPYAIVHYASTRHFDNQGKLDYTFEAESLQYYREKVAAEGKVTLQNYTDVEQPRLTIFHEGQPWLLKARHGKFTEENRHLLLWNHVEVSNIVEREKQTTLTTEKLEIKPEEKYAYTQEPVKISSASGEIKAKGMIANFAEKQITLLSKVQGQHDPLL